MSKDDTNSPQAANDDGFIIDEEFKNLLPPLTPEDFGKLENSILVEGCRDDLVVWAEENILIDGHHRFAICKKHNLPYGTDGRSFANRDAVIAWMFENQKSRRNMNKFQWAEVVLKRKDSIAATAKTNQRAGGGAVRLKTDKPVNTLKKLAKLAGIGRDTMHKVEFILTTAALNPDNEKLAEQINKLRKGSAGISIRSVYEELQRFVSTKRATGKKREPKAIARKRPQYNPLTPEQTDLIFATIEEDIETQYHDIGDRIVFYQNLEKWARHKISDLAVLALSQK